MCRESGVETGSNEAVMEVAARACIQVGRHLHVHLVALPQPHGAAAASRHRLRAVALPQ